MIHVYSGLDSCQVWLKDSLSQFSSPSFNMKHTQKLTREAHFLKKVGQFYWPEFKFEFLMILYRIFYMDFLKGYCGILKKTQYPFEKFM